MSHALPLLTGFGGLRARICSLVRMEGSGRQEMLAPCQGAGENGSCTGGVASLNRRLMAGNPPGSRRRGGVGAWGQWSRGGSGAVVRAGFVCCVLSVVEPFFPDHRIARHVMPPQLKRRQVARSPWCWPAPVLRLIRPECPLRHSRRSAPWLRRQSLGEECNTRPNTLDIRPAEENPAAYATCLIGSRVLRRSSWARCRRQRVICSRTLAPSSRRK